MPGLQGLRVLLVEDELLIATMMEEALAGFGCEVVGPFPSLAPALKAIERELLDVAVLDVNVRGEMVFPLAERLKTRGVPVVFCTGYAEVSVIPPEFQGYPCVGKPCIGAALKEALSRNLASA